jgi:hypothetical protein
MKKSTEQAFVLKGQAATLREVLKDHPELKSGPMGALLNGIVHTPANKEAPGNKAYKKEAPKKEAPKREAPKKEAPKKDAPKKEAPKKEATQREASKEAPKQDDLKILQLELEMAKLKLEREMLLSQTTATTELKYDSAKRTDQIPMAKVVSEGRQCEAIASHGKRCKTFTDDPSYRYCSTHYQQMKKEDNSEELVRIQCKHPSFDKCRYIKESGLLFCVVHNS